MGLPVYGEVLVQRGQALGPIVVSAEATAAESTAAAELASYLQRATGARFDVIVEPAGTVASAAIYVGATQRATQSGLHPSALAPEQWCVWPQEGSLILAGGRQRGTLYAVYRFLEDDVGVRWWTPYDESIPRLRSLALPAKRRCGQPAFAHRDVTTIDGPAEFRARSRLNGHFAALPASLGGHESFGPPFHAHTFQAYLPPSTYFAAHPEWYAEVDGIRRSERTQLCLSAPGLIEELTSRLDEFVLEGRAKARQRGEPAPRYYSVSPNDVSGWCGCPACTDVAARSGAASGALVTVLRALAERAVQRNPEIRLEMLAYWDTFDAPRLASPLPENTLVRLSALQYRNFSVPLEHPDNRRYLQTLAAWRELAPHLWIWDYSVTFGPWGDLPLPNLPVLAADLRSYLALDVEGVLVQHEHPIDADLRDLKLWVLVRLIEDPTRGLDALVRDFTDGYYGAAGSLIRRYLRDLERALARRPTHVGYPAIPTDYDFLQPEVLSRLHRRFDVATERVAADEVLLRRVNHARLSLDRATLLRLPLVDPSRWVDRGNDRLDPARIARRYRQTWKDETGRRLSSAQAARVMEQVDSEIELLLAEIVAKVAPRRGEGPN